MYDDLGVEPYLLRKLASIGIVFHVNHVSTLIAFNSTNENVNESLNMCLQLKTWDEMFMAFKWSSMVRKIPLNSNPTVMGTYKSSHYIP